MAAPVRRGDGGKHEEFSLPDAPDIGGDMAMVGGDDGGADLDIAPSDNNEDWDLGTGGKVAPPQGKAPSEEFDQEDSRLAYEDTGEAPPEERESKSRRARRNARTREFNRLQEDRIEYLNNQLQALGGVVQRLTYGQAGLAANTLDGQIGNLEQALRMADQEMADAVKTNNGDKYAEVNRLRDEVVARLWSTKQQRMRMGEGVPQQQAPQNQQPQHQQPQQQQRVDPEVADAVADKFERFQDRFPWFDPTSADADCNIVRAIDTELVAQGHQRHTTAFWQMMEQKMAGYGMTPNRGGDQDEGDVPARRSNGNTVLGRDVPIPTRRASGPPTGSGRSTRATGAGYALSEWQRDALRDEGLLEDKLSDAEIAKRDRIVSKWRKGTESLRRNGRMN